MDSAVHFSTTTVVLKSWHAIYAALQRSILSWNTKSVFENSTFTRPRSAINLATSRAITGLRVKLGSTGEYQKYPSCCCDRSVHCHF